MWWPRSILGLHVVAHDQIGIICGGPGAYHDYMWWPMSRLGLHVVAHEQIRITCGGPGAY